MPSNAFGDLISLMQNPDEILDAQTVLLAGMGAAPAVPAQWGIGALNRAAVVMLVAAWEAYIERVAIEAVQALRPPAAPFGSWAALDIWVRDEAQRLHTPDVQQVRRLISGAVGIVDITTSWTWLGVAAQDARRRLGNALEVRNQVAHGANPIVATTDATGLRQFFEQLGAVTDAAIRTHLQNAYRVNPWPL